jgi:hypothetical protein
MSETLRDAIGDGIETARRKALEQRWAERSAEAQAILPPGWDVYVEPAPSGDHFRAKVTFTVAGGKDAFSALDAVVAYYRSIQDTGAAGRLVLARPGDLARLRRP